MGLFSISKETHDDGFVWDSRSLNRCPALGWEFHWMMKGRFHYLTSLCFLALVLLPGSCFDYEQRQTKRPDGSTIDWYIGKAKIEKSPILFYTTGAGCESLSSPEEKMLRDIFTVFSEDYTVIAAEKYGVVPGNNPADRMISRV